MGEGVGGEDLGGQVDGEAPLQGDEPPAHGLGKALGDRLPAAEVPGPVAVEEGELLAGADAKTAFDKDGLLDELKKALAERALNAELDHHLDVGESDGNRRNGYGKKTVLTGTGKGFENQITEKPMDMQEMMRNPEAMKKMMEGNKGK